MMIKTFYDIDTFINSKNRTIEIIIPEADSSSALKAAADFMDIVKGRAYIRLYGKRDSIKRMIKENGLTNLLDYNRCRITETMTDTFNIVMRDIDKRKNQIILKGNTTSDVLMKSLLKVGKKKFIEKNKMITHMRLFESPSGISLMTDGGINIGSNLDKNAKNRLDHHVRSNALRVMKMFDAENNSLFTPAHFMNIDDLNNEFITAYVKKNRFPRIIQFPWIGPANIIYKAIEKFHWEIKFQKDISIPVKGRLFLFSRGEDKKPFFLAVPERDASFQEKAELLARAIEQSNARGAATAKVALLDFTEQYSSFMTVPSIRESRQLVYNHQNNPHAIVEGPMAYDVAVSLKAAEIKGFPSEVAGGPDVLFLPDYTSGVILACVYRYRSIYSFPWKAADISFGGPVPILLPSRSDSPEHKLRSLIVAAYISMMKLEKV